MGAMFKCAERDTSHCRQCGWVPLLEKSIVIAKQASDTSRLIFKTTAFAQAKYLCQPSVPFTEKALLYLECAGSAGAVLSYIGACQRLESFFNRKHVSAAATVIT